MSFILDFRLSWYSQSIIVLYKNHLFFMFLFLSLLRRWLLMMSFDPYRIWHWSCLVLRWFLVYDSWFLARPWYLPSIWNHSFDSWSYYPLIVTPSMMNHILACYWFMLLDYCFLDFLLFLLFTIWSLISVFCVESSLLGYYVLIISRDQSCLLFVALDSHPWILSTYYCKWLSVIHSVGYSGYCQWFLILPQTLVSGVHTT